MQNYPIMTLAFEAEVTVHQTIRLLSSVSESDVVAGLKAGSIITTMWHNQGEMDAYNMQCALLDITLPVDLQLIGFVESQQVDGDYHDFR